MLDLTLAAFMAPAVVVCMFNLSRFLVLRTQEAEAFAEAASLPTHKALVYTFLARRSTQKACCHVTCIGPESGFANWANRDLSSVWDSSQGWWPGPH